MDYSKLSQEELEAELRRQAASPDGVDPALRSFIGGQKSDGQTRRERNEQDLVDSGVTQGGVPQGSSAMPNVQGGDPRSDADKRASIAEWMVDQDNNGRGGEETALRWLLNQGPFSSTSGEGYLAMKEAMPTAEDLRYTDEELAQFQLAMGPDAARASDSQYAQLGTGYNYDTLNQFLQSGGTQANALARAGQDLINADGRDAVAEAQFRDQMMQGQAAARGQMLAATEQQRQRGLGSSGADLMARLGMGSTMAQGNLTAALGAGALQDQRRQQQIATGGNLLGTAGTLNQGIGTAFNTANDARASGQDAWNKWLANDDRDAANADRARAQEVEANRVNVAKTGADARREAEQTGFSNLGALYDRLGRGTSEVAGMNYGNPGSSGPSAIEKIATVFGTAGDVAKTAAEGYKAVKGASE